MSDCNISKNVNVDEMYIQMISVSFAVYSLMIELKIFMYIVF